MAKGLKAADLRGKEIAELEELVRTTQGDLLKNRFQNYTNRLNDSSAMRRLRRDVAKVLTVLGEKRRATAATAKKES